MAREFKIRLSEDLPVADVFMALEDKCDELYEEGEVNERVEIDIEAREFKIRLSEDLSVADVFMALEDKCDELYAEGEVDERVKIDVEARDDLSYFDKYKK